MTFDINRNQLRSIIILVFLFMLVYCSSAQELKTSPIAKVSDEKDSTKRKDELSKAQTILFVNQSLQSRRNNVLLMSFILIGFSCLIVYLRLRAGQKIKSLNLQLSKQKKATQLLLDHEQNNRLVVAKEIHDQVGQTLSVAKMNLSNMVDQSPKDDHLNSTIDLIDQAVNELRKISHQLLPEGSSFGLIGAIEEYVYQIDKEGLVKIEFQSLGEPWVVEKTKQLSIFEVIQGILVYRINHAEATEINIKLLQREKDVVLEIYDNGLSINLWQDCNVMEVQKTIARLDLLEARLSTSNKLIGNEIQVIFPKYDGSN